MTNPLGFPVVRLLVLLVLAGMCLPGDLAAAEGDWPAWRYDAGRTAASPHELPADLRLQWKRELPAPRPAFPNDPRLRFDGSYEPIITGNRVVLPSMVTDSISALKSDTGEALWTFFADGPVRFAPLAWEGKVYFVSDMLVTHGGEAIDLVSGEKRPRMWKGMNSELRGCGRALGSPCLITVRDAHLSYYDLAGGRHLHIRGIRGGCTNSLIPADGILSAPNYMRHCTCNYAVATSLGLVTMPEASAWDAR